MKKFKNGFSFNKMLFVLFITFVLFVFATSKKEDYLSSNDSLAFTAIVTKVDSKNNRIYANSVDNVYDFTSPRYLNCNNADLVYAEFTSDYIKRLDVEDFEIGDEIKVLADWNSFDGNSMNVKTHEVQLLTQRFGENITRKTSVKGSIEKISGKHVTVRYTTENEGSAFHKMTGIVDCSKADIVCINNEDSFDTTLDKLRKGDSIAVDVEIEEIKQNQKKLYDIRRFETDRIIVYDDVSHR